MLEQTIAPAATLDMKDNKHRRYDGLDKVLAERRREAALVCGGMLLLFATVAALFALLGGKL